MDYFRSNATVSNQITIHSVTGRLEFEKLVPPQVNPHVVELPLAPGVYLITNTNNKGVRSLVKVLTPPLAPPRKGGG